MDNNESPCHVRDQSNPASALSPGARANEAGSQQQLNNPGRQPTNTNSLPQAAVFPGGMPGVNNAFAPNMHGMPNASTSNVLSGAFTPTHFLGFGNMPGNGNQQFSGFPGALAGMQPLRLPNMMSGMHSSDQMSGQQQQSMAGLQQYVGGLGNYPNLGHGVGAGVFAQAQAQMPNLGGFNLAGQVHNYGGGMAPMVNFGMGPGMGGMDRLSGFESLRGGQGVSPIMSAHSMPGHMTNPVGGQGGTMSAPGGGAPQSQHTSNSTPQPHSSTNMHSSHTNVTQMQHGSFPDSAAHSIPSSQAPLNNPQQNVAAGAPAAATPGSTPTPHPADPSAPQPQAPAAQADASCPSWPTPLNSASGAMAYSNNNGIPSFHPGAYQPGMPLMGLSSTVGMPSSAGLPSLPPAAQHFVASLLGGFFPDSGGAQALPAHGPAQAWPSFNKPPCSTPAADTLQTNEEPQLVKELSTGTAAMMHDAAAVLGKRARATTVQRSNSGPAATACTSSAGGSMEDGKDGSRPASIIEKRLKQNREAARRSRERKRQLKNELRRRMPVLQKQHDDMVVEVDELMKSMWSNVSKLLSPEMQDLMLQQSEYMEHCAGLATVLESTDDAQLIEALEKTDASWLALLSAHESVKSGLGMFMLFNAMHAPPAHWMWYQMGGVQLSLVIRAFLQLAASAPILSADTRATLARHVECWSFHEAILEQGKGLLRDTFFQACIAMARQREVGQMGIPPPILGHLDTLGVLLSNDFGLRKQIMVSLRKMLTPRQMCLLLVVQAALLESHASV